MNASCVSIVIETWKKSPHLQLVTNVFLFKKPIADGIELNHVCVCLTSQKVKPSFDGSQLKSVECPRKFTLSL